MEKLGEIVAIIDDQRLLVRANTVLGSPAEYVIFARVPLQIAGFPVEHIDVPKGSVRIIADQGQNFYLFERFRHKGPSKRVVKPGIGVAGLFQKEEVIEETPGDWSVSFNSEQSLGLKVDLRVQVGDFLARS